MLSRCFLDFSVDVGAFVIGLRKKEEIWLSPLTNASTLTEKSKKQHENIKNSTKNFDYTTIESYLFPFL